MSNLTNEFKHMIPLVLPKLKDHDKSVDHAPKRPSVLNKNQRKLAIANALRYFPSEWHEILGSEFSKELDDFGHIYMYRFRPDYEMFARTIEEYPAINIRQHVLC